MSLALIKSNDKWGVAVAVIACLFFGLYPAASRAAYADGANAVFLLLLATAARAFFLVGFCLWNHEVLFSSLACVKMALRGGFWLALSVIGIMTSLVYIPGPIVLIIVALRSLILLFFMAWRGEQRIDKNTLLSTIVALIGVGLVLNLWQGNFTFSGVGVALAFMACVATVFQFYVYGKQMNERPPIAVGAESFVVATALIFCLLFWQRPVMPETLSGWGWTFVSVASLVIGVFGMFYGIALLGPFRWSLFAKTETLFAALFAAALLSEYLSLAQYIGIILVAGSLTLYEIFNRQANLRRERALPLARE